MMELPEFGIGQVKGVAEYVRLALPGLADHLRLMPEDATMLERLFLASLTAATEAMPRFMEEAFAPAIPAGRKLFDWLGSILLLDDSRLVGEEHVAQALALQASGANVLLVSNHTSGADHPAMEFLINRQLGVGTTHPWVYMAGHVVNYYLVPLMLSDGINRIQIVSARYRNVSRERGDERDEWMARRNMVAIRYLMNYVRPGGRFVVMYPEGGRGDDALKLGEPRTMKIPEVISRCSNALLYLLPCYVSGATSVLPQHRELEEREFTAVLSLARRGTVTARFSEPVPWKALQPTCCADMGITENCPGEERSIAEKMYLLGRVMEQIANLGITYINVVVK